MSGWYWSRLHRPSSDDLATYLEHLKALNVVWRATSTVAASYTSDPETGRLMKSIGVLLFKPKTGQITCVPYTGLIMREQFVLAQMAQEAFENAPRTNRRWAYQRATCGYWRTGIAVPADIDGDPTAAAVARAITRSSEILRVELRLADEMAASGV